jgi:hypothetical protein
MSAANFRDAAETVVHRVTANSVDRFFCDAAAYLEDRFDNFSAGPSLRRVVDDLLGMLELTDDCSRIQIRNRLSPDKQCWEDAWDTLSEKALVDAPRVLTTYEVTSLLEAFDDRHHGKIHGDNIETVVRIVRMFGVEKAAEKLKELEEACDKKTAP